MSAATFDTIIVGGGIIGAGIAWRLARENRRVLVLDANRLGTGATHAGAGMLGAQVEMHHPGPLYEFGIYSRSLFDSTAELLKDESQIDIELDRSGLFRVAASEEDRNELKTRFSWQAESGQPAEWLEPEHLPAELQKILGVNYGALYLPLDHQVRNPQYLHATVVAAQKSGAVFVENAAVHRILTASGSTPRVIGVETYAETYYADQVVLAAGAWSGKLASTIGIQLGVFPMKGQALLVNSRPHLTPYTLFTHGVYLVPKHTGQTYIGATEDQAGFSLKPLSKNVKTLLTSAEQLVPSVSETEFAGNLVGLRPGSEDGLPFIGSHDAYQGLFIASGHFRNGILLSAATAVVMAELLTGKELSFDISAFDPNRNNGAVPKV